MAAALNDQQLAVVQQQLTAHPEIMQAFKDYNDWASHRGRLQYVTGGGPPTPQQVLAKYGINFPDIEDYQIQVDPQGNVGLKRQGFFQRNADWILPVATIGTGAGISALTAGGPAAATAGGGAGGTLPSTATVGPTGALAPAVTPATDFTAGTTTASVPAGGGILGSLGKYGGLFGDLGNVLTTASSSDANARRADAANNARAIAENNAAKVQAAQFNLGLPSVRTNQVARGEVLNTMQNAPLTGDARIDKFSGGGLRPSAFGPQSRQAGSLLASTALNGLQNPSQDRLTPQEIPPSSPSTLDNIGAGAGLGLGIFSLLSKYGRNPNGTNPNGMPPYFPGGNS